MPDRPRVVWRTRHGLAAILAFALCACGGASGPDKNKVVVRYREKWTGFEADAMRAVVDDFNASQDRIFVDFSSVSQLDRRLMLSISGGVPPDVAGITGRSLPTYAENHALTPLDRLAASHFIPQLTTWPIYSSGMTQAFDRIWAGKAGAREALDDVQRHEQQAFDRRQERWDRSAARRLAQIEGIASTEGNDAPSPLPIPCFAA